MTDNNDSLADRTGTEVLDFEDRRRLACTEMLLTAERNGGQVQLAEYGQIVLRAVVDENEVVQMGDRVLHVLAKNRMEGGLG